MYCVTAVMYFRIAQDFKQLLAAFDRYVVN
jgi:hypothetical protein